MLDKGTGSFTLTFIFYDGTDISFTQDELLNGDVFMWNIERVLLTNTAQSGKSIKLLLDIQLDSAKTISP